MRIERQQHPTKIKYQIKHVILGVIYVCWHIQEANPAAFIMINGHRAHMLIVPADFVDSKNHYRTAATIHKSLMY